MIPSSEISFQDFDSVRTNFQHVIRGAVETETGDFHGSAKAIGTASPVRLDQMTGWVKEGLQERVIIFKPLDTSPDILNWCLTGD